MQRNLHGRTCPGKSGLAAHVETLGTTNTLEAMAHDTPDYLLSNQLGELERLQLQSRVWEPAARALLAGLPRIPECKAVDIGCGVMGWLRVLSEWVGRHGRVVGTDVDANMLDRANALATSEALSNVELVADDLFRSALPANSFDLVHARFQIAPLGRASEQLASYRRLLRPGGILIVEDPDMASWRVNPDGSATHELIGLIERGFLAAGGNFNAGRDIPALMRSMGLEPRVTAHVVALDPGHPYLRLPLQFATSMRARLEALASPSHLSALLEQVEAELAREGTWGTTFTLIQSWAVEPTPR
jgi:SAM-dependent methyltransferase